MRITDIYSRCAPEYMEYWGHQLSERGRLLVGGMRLAGARRVLDLGCGVGTNLTALAEAAPGVFVVGADGAEGMVRLASGARVVVDAHALAFQGETFDATLIAFVLHHVARPDVTVREIHRVLRPGGWIAAGTWADDPEDLAANRIWTEELDAHGAALPPDVLAGHAATNSPDKMRSLLADGFDVERIELSPLDDPMDVGQFLRRRTKLGVQGWRYDSLDVQAREACLAKARARLERLGPDDLNARETAILTWARKRA